MAIPNEAIDEATAKSRAMPFDRTRTSTSQARKKRPPALCENRFLRAIQ